ncbi:MAG: sugar phosphate isomerase/epimerase [Chitinophagaceae bacterium]|jgi:sugar phosphate isomerase/epimerase|nr:sugar phosphate isomerase/epimerase [Chitinophagaceae bacterium]
MSLNRRKFLSTTTTAMGGAVLGSFTQNTIMNKPSFAIPPNFNLKILATNWGLSATVDEFCAKAKAEGYDGIEMWWPGSKEKQDELFAALKKHRLDIGFLCGSGESSFEKNIQQFQQQINAATTQTAQKPLYINCHSGKDFFSFEQNKKFIETTIEAAKKSGIPISHETHRSRILYAAPIARQYVEAIQGLRITLDISHWCNVHESLLHDQEDTVDLILQRVDHIHARVGHPEGPQVNDPRAPEWDAAVKRHIEWWDKVIALKIKQGATQQTVLTEFGPPDSLPALPYTRQPVANQWEINVYMMNLLRKRYSNK